MKSFISINIIRLTSFKNSSLLPPTFYISNKNRRHSNDERTLRFLKELVIVQLKRYAAKRRNEFHPKFCYFGNIPHTTRIPAPGKQGWLCETLRGTGLCIPFRWGLGIVRVTVKKRFRSPDDFSAPETGFQRYTLGNRFPCGSVPTASR